MENVTKLLTLNIIGLTKKLETRKPIIYSILGISFIYANQLSEPKMLSKLISNKLIEATSDNFDPQFKQFPPTLPKVEEYINPNVSLQVSFA